MLHVMKNRLERFEPAFYIIFRLLVGFMFFAHGVQKFGWFGGQVQPIASLMGIAGLIEVIAGLLVFFGLLTRLAAFVSAIEMLVAYVMVHAPNGWNPLINKGELALLYFAAFLILLIYGAGSWGLEKAFFRKERF